MVGHPHIFAMHSNRTQVYIFLVVPNDSLQTIHSMRLNVAKRQECEGFAFWIKLRYHPTFTCIVWIAKDFLFCSLSDQFFIEFIVVVNQANVRHKKKVAHIFILYTNTPTETRLSVDLYWRRFKKICSISNGIMAWMSLNGICIATCR